MTNKKKTFEVFTGKSANDFVNTVDWAKSNGLVPVIAQEYLTNKVLMLGYMNKEALQKTLEQGKITYYSRTRQILWTKGETSGSFQFIKAIFLDCDSDAILIKVKQKGAVCHDGHKTCFYKKFHKQ